MKWIEEAAEKIERSAREYIDSLKKYSAALMVAYDVANKTFRITSDTSVDDAISLIAKRDDMMRLWQEQNPRPTKAKHFAAVIETAYRESHPVDTDLSAVRGKLEAIRGDFKKFNIPHGDDCYDYQDNAGKSELKDMLSAAWCALRKANVDLTEALALMEGK